MPNSQHPLGRLPARTSGRVAVVVASVNIAFAAGDGRVLAVTLAHRTTSWQVAAFDPPANEASVDLRHRRVALWALRSTQGLQVGWEATITGSAGFPAAPGSDACG